MPTTRDAKKRRERELAELLVSLLGGDPPWKIFEHDDSPDFVLQRGDERVGLEVTELFRSDDGGRHGSTARATEVLRGTLASEAARLWDARGLPPVRVRISF